DDVVIAVAHRAALERRQIRARVGLGEALAPDLVAAEDRGKMPGLLLIAAEGDQQRTDDGQRHGNERGRAGEGALLLEGILLGLAPARPAVLDGPPRRHPALLEESAMPVHQLVPAQRRPRL